jgi:hypothetical protein
MKKTTKTIAFLLALIMMFAVMPQITLPVSAFTWSDYAKVTKNDSYNKDGKFYMSFTIENLDAENALANPEGARRGVGRISIYAEIKNPSGNVIKYWQEVGVGPGEKSKWDYGTDFSEMPTGTYTFRLQLRIPSLNAGKNFYKSFTYNINHKAPEGSFSYVSAKAWYDDHGRYWNSIEIQIKNMKGHNLFYKVYNEYGDIVYIWNGKEIKTNDETHWFSWDGYTDGVRQPSGEYTFVITSSANKKIVEKTLKLTIREAVKG